MTKVSSWRRVGFVSNPFFRFVFSLGLSALLHSTAGAQNQIAVTVRHAPNINSGRVEGSVRQLSGEDVTLNGGATLTGDLLVPGTPSVRLNGHPNYAGVIAGSGAATPSNYRVTLNGNVSLGYLRTRTDPEALTPVPPAPAPTGTRNVTINSPNGSAGDWATVRDLTLNGNVGPFAVPPGTYRDFKVNGGSSLVLGVANSAQPVVYNLQRLNLNGNSELQIVGPVQLNLANGLSINGRSGTAANPAWLELRVSSGGVTLNGGSSFYGLIKAPNGTLTVNGNSLLVGSAQCDRFTLNGSGLVRWADGAIAQNQAPVVNAGTDQTVLLPAAAALNGAVSDDGLPLGGNLTVAWSQVSGPGTTAFANPGTAATTASFSLPGIYVLRLTASDSALTRSDDLSITVVQPNRPPVAEGQTVVTPENVAANFALAASDPDGDALTFTILTQPAHGTLAGTAPNLVYTPALHFFGSDSFTFKVSDGTLESATATVVIDVTPINDAPVADSQSVLLNEDGSLELTLTGSDVEGDPLTFAVVTSPAHGTLAGTPPNLVYTPAADFFGTDSFAFTVSDGATVSAPALVALAVAGINDAPSFSKGADQTIAEGSAAQSVPNWATGIAAGPANESGQALEFIVATDNAALFAVPPAISAEGTLTYTPAGQASGLANITVQLRDNGGIAGGGVDTSAPQTFLITVTAVNDGPALTAPAAAAVNEDSQFTFNSGNAIAVSDPDAGGLPLRVTLAVSNGTLTLGDTTGLAFAEGANATASFSVTGDQADLNRALATLAYAPHGNFAGNDALVVTVNDQGNTGAGGPLSDTRTVALTINPLNDPPAARDHAAETDEDAAVALVLEADDVDGDALTFTVVTPPAQGMLSGVAPNLAYTPAADFFGSDRFTFKVSDGSLESAVATVTLTIRPVNDAPLAQSQARATSEDASLALLLAGTDADGDALTFTLLTLPAHGTLNVGLGVLGSPELIYTPAPNFHGADAFSFKVNDGTVDSAPAMVAINVLPVNDPPVADVQTLNTPEDTPLDITLTGSDVEGSALTFILETAPAQGTLNVSPGPLNSPVVRYTPNPDFNGADSFTFKVSDGALDSALATVVILVNDVNDPPIAAAQAVSTLEDTPKSIVLAGADPEGGSLEFTVLDAPAHGVLSGTPPNLVYTPALNFHGPDRFTFKANDGSLDSAPAAVSITVEPVNDAPVAVGDALSTNEDIPLAITLTGTDVESAALAFTVTAPPAHGTLSGTPPNLIYTPALDYHGADAFTFQVNDGVLGSVSGTISLSIQPVNDPPGFVKGPDQTVPEDTGPQTIPNWATQIHAGPANETGQALEFLVSADNAALFSVPPAVSPDGTLTFAPAAHASGTALVTLRLRDDGGGTDTSEPQTFNITVTSVNDAPLVSAPANVSAVEDNAFIFGAGQPISVDDLDAAANAIQLLLSVNHGELTLASTGGLIFTGGANGTGSFVVAGTVADLNAALLDLRYQPNPNFSGLDSLLIVSDDLGHTGAGGPQTDAKTVLVNVTPVNDPPGASPQNLVTDEDTPLPITLASVDPDGDALTFSIVTAPAHGSLSGTPPHLVYTPEPGFNGTDQFTFKANDGVLDSADAVVEITVNAANDPPAAHAQTVSVDEDGSVSITLTGTDPEGSSLSFTVVTAPLHGTLSGTPPAVTYSPAPNFHGSDSFAFKVNDGQADSDPAMVSISVASINDPPVVNAGPDEAVTLPGEVSLNGVVTDDGTPAPPQLTITWSVTSGPGPVVFANPASAVTTASFTASGVYTLRLTANDGAAQNWDEIVVTANAAPLVEAGPDAFIELGQALELAGTATDDGLPTPPTLTTLWAQLSGPGTVTFDDAAALSTRAQFSERGTYTLRLTAQDGLAIRHDDLTVTAHTPPVVNAGSDLSGTLSQIFNLNGNASDDGLPGLLTIGWSQVSGPAGILFGNPDQAVATARFLAPGTYVLRLSASDTHVVATDEITVQVRPDGVNQPPVVSAGADQTIGLASTAQLNGQVSDDGLPFNNPVTAQWSLVSGPGTVNFGDSGALQTTATFSAQGHYVLRLTASDGELTGSDEVELTIFPNNQPPVVNAGVDQAVTLPNLSAPAAEFELPSVTPRPYDWRYELSTPGLSGVVSGSSFIQVSRNALSASGPNVFAGGTFTHANGVEVQALAHWNGCSFVGLFDPRPSDPNNPNSPPLGFAPFGAVSSLGARGQQVFAGGVFKDLSLPPDGQLDWTGHWAGSAWNEWNFHLADGNTFVSILTIAPTASGVYVGGAFLGQPAPYSCCGTIPNLPISYNIMFWDGAQWHALGEGLRDLRTTNPLDLNYAVVDDIAVGPAGEVYASGSFMVSTPSGVAHNIARWNGTTWEALGTGLSGGTAPRVYAVAVDAQGRVYVGGSFTTAGGATANNIAQWDGTAWSALGSGAANGVSHTVNDLLVHQGRLYAGGSFVTAGGKTVNRIAAWDGADWSALGSGANAGVNATVTALAASESGVHLGGQFTTAGGRPASFIAKWGVPEPPIASCPSPVTVLINSPAGGAATLTGHASHVCGRELTVTWRVDGGPVIQSRVLPASTTQMPQPVEFTHTFTPGVHTVTMTVDDYEADPVLCHTTVTVPPSMQTTLRGSVTDDGLPLSSSITRQWSMLSGPGSVLFADAQAAETAATFTTPGVYVLRFTASDSEFSGSDDLTVTVSENQPPVVNAGSDQIIRLPASASLSAQASDDGQPAALSVHWSKVSGPGTVAFADSQSAQTTASFSEAGRYILRFTATDSQITRSDDLIIEAKPACQSPESGLAAWWRANGTTRDEVSGGFATRLNGASFGSGADGQAFQFDGLNDGIRVPACPALDVGLAGGLTLEAWISPDDLGSRPLFLWKDGNGNNGVQLYTSVPLAGGGPGSLFANVVDTTGNSHFFSTAPGVLVAGEFQHVALTYDRASGSAALYWNGLLVASQNLGFFTPLTSSHLYLGHNPSPAASFKGRMDDAAIYDRALTANEIEILVSEASASKCAPPPAALSRAEAAGEFSIAANPNGAWTYGWRTALEAPFIVFASSSSDANVLSWQPSGAFLSSYPLVARNRTDGLLNLGSSTVAPDVLWMHPGPLGQYAVVRWTAPAAGIYRLIGFFEGLNAPNTRSDVHIRRNSTASLFTGLLSTRGELKPFELIQLLGAGDTVDFTVGYGTDLNYSGDSTGLHLVIETLGELAPNESPLVNAGADRVVVLPGSATLNATLADDALPPGNPLTFAWSVVSGPGSVTFSPASGTAASASIPTLASFAAPGTYQLRLSASDGELSLSDDVLVNVYPAGTVNQPPAASAGTDQTVSLLEGTQLAGAASDDGLPVNSSLITTWSKVSGPGTVTFENLHAPQTSAQFNAVGTYVLRLTANDGALTHWDEVTITVNQNQAPQVNAGADITLPQNQTATLAGTASDDGLPAPALTLTWSLVSGPGTAAFSPASTTTGSPANFSTTASFSAPGTYIVRLSATDGQQLGTDELTVFVTPPPNLPPLADAGLDQSINWPAESTLAGTAFDDGLPSATLITSWSQVSGPGAATFSTVNGVYRASFSLPGTYVLRFTASDGEFSASDDLVVTAHNNLPPPVAEIHSPLDSAIITAPVSVTGTIQSSILQSWTLEHRLRPAEADEATALWITLATGATEISSAPLASFDPTLLLNGLYEMRLSATDTIGRTTVTDPITVIVDRNLKIGNFTLSFNDLTIPVAGIPITITRTYDSRDKRPGDFGIGWTLDLKNIRLQKNRLLGKGWVENTSGGLLPVYSLDSVRSRTVTLTFPNNRVEKFTFTPNPSIQPLLPISYPQWNFTPIGNTRGTLVPATFDEPDGNFLAVIGSIPGAVDLVDLNYFSDNPLSIGDELDRYPTLFRYESPDGYRYLVDEREGLKSLTDPNGNTLLVSTNGLTWTNAVAGASLAVAFQRDPLGRITNILDAAGHAMSYLYDTAGNLAGFRDRVGHTNGFTYDGRHNLLTIADPRGVTPVRNEYDASGRLISHTDAFGKTITYTHDLQNRQEVIEDRLGNVTVHEYDEHGNVVRSVAADGGVSAMSYDARDNLLTQTDPLNRTTTHTYDTEDNRLTTTDPLGKVTRLTYGALRRVTSVTDPRGNVVTNRFDASGNLLSMGDPLGHVTTFGYDTKGLPLATTNALGHVTRFTYDITGRLESETDALGHSTSYTRDPNGNLLTQSTTRTTASGVETLLVQFRYDAQSRLTNTVFPDGSSTRTIYNAIGKPALTLDPLGRATVTEYDDLGRVRRMVHPDGTNDGTAYDDEGRRIASTNRLGHVTQFDYDAVGRLFRTRHPDGTATTNWFDLAGQIIATSDARGNSTFFGYDAAGRTVAVTNALGQISRSFYDAAGNLTNAVDALGRSTSFLHDALNRRYQTVFADGTTQTAWFDPLGRRTHEQDQAGKVTAFGYDPIGRMTAVTNALGYVTRYTHDELGQERTQTDANNHTTTFDYDSLGRRVRRTLPGGQFETYAWRVDGALTNRTDFNGFSTTFQYDNMNRLLAKVPDPRRGEPTITYAYDELGRRTNMIDAVGTASYAYDSRSRLIESVRTWGAQLTLGLSYHYDEAGNLTNVLSSDPNGTALGYAYDALNRLEAVNDTRVGRTAYTYDDVGNLRTTTLPNGVTSLHQYDSLNRLTNLASSKLLTPLATYSYTVGPSGHRTSASETLHPSIFNPHPSAISRIFSYDDVYRLKGEALSLNSQPATLNYSYDPVGNRLSRASPLLVLPVQNFGYDRNDRLNTDTYDPNGNTLLSPGFGLLSPDRYDFENRLGRRQAVLNGQPATIDLFYDGDGQRIAKTVTTASGALTTYYLVDDLNPTGYAQVLEEHVALHTQPPALHRVYTHGHALLSQDRLEGSQWVTSFYGLDGHQNVRFLTDLAGNVTDTYDYDAFGNLIASTGTTSNSHLFTAEQYDADLGLYYLRARYHNPQTGRFWSMDAFEGYGSDPASLHKYAYCGNNPVNCYDPSGNITLTELGQSTAIRAGLTTGLFGAFSGGYSTYRHNGNQFGWNVAVNAGFGFGAGFAAGYFLGPLPATAWQTPAARGLIATLSAMGLTQAVNEMQSGYPDLAALDAIFSLAPFLLSPRQTVQVLESRYSAGRILRESTGAAIMRDGEFSASAASPKAYSTAIRADIAESSAYNQALIRGEIGLQRPGGANILGPDFITARLNRRTGFYEIVVTDVKSSSTGNFPSQAGVMSATWLAEAQAAIARLGLQSTDLEQEIRSAAAAGRFVLRQLNVNYSATSEGQGNITGF